jgi:hypothetical protein
MEAWVRHIVMAVCLDHDEVFYTQGRTVAELRDWVAGHGEDCDIASFTSEHMDVHPTTEAKR